MNSKYRHKYRMHSAQSLPLIPAVFISGGTFMRYAIAWLLGVPISILIVIYILTHVF